MNYLGRPIFPFKINWANSISRSVVYELKDILLGFGAELFQPTQTYTVNTWEFSVMLKNGQDILDFETFADGLLGRLNGFWLPCPIEAAEFVNGISATQFDIIPEDLQSTWADRPDQHLLLKYPDGTERAAKIQAVATSGNYERVTLTAPLAEVPPAGTIIKRLHYVRFSTDTEKGQFLAENVLSLSLSVLELPLEYAEAQTGLRPIYLYHFFCNAPATYHWRYTSFAAGVVSQNKLYGAFAMTHGALKDSVKADSQTLSIEAIFDDTHPFSMFLPLPPQRPVNIEVFKVFYGDLDTQTLIFSGQIANVQDDGEKLNASCDSWSKVLSRKSPRMLFKSDCNNVLYDPLTCKVIRAQWQTTAQIVAINSAQIPPTVTVDLLYDALPQFADWITDDWFAKGFLETGFHLNFEVRTILKSLLSHAPNRITLTLNAPLRRAQEGQIMQLVKGCPGTWEACGAFNNQVNFGGFRSIPSRNLTLKGLNTTVSQGNKK